MRKWSLYIGAESGHVSGDCRKRTALRHRVDMPRRQVIINEVSQRLRWLEAFKAPLSGPVHHLEHSLNRCRDQFFLRAEVRVETAVGEAGPCHDCCNADPLGPLHLYGRCRKFQQPFTSFRFMFAVVAHRPTSWWPPPNW